MGREGLTAVSQHSCWVITGTLEGLILLSFLGEKGWGRFPALSIKHTAICPQRNGGWKPSRLLDYLGGHVDDSVLLFDFQLYCTFF